MFRTRKAKKGLSGAVTALILVIASVIIALVVVGFAFGLFGAFGGTPTVTQSGTGTLYLSNGTAVITLHSTGSVQITAAQISGQAYSVNNLAIQLNAGTQTVYITFNLGTSPTLSQGSPYTIVLTLSDGQTADAAVIAQ